MANARSHEVTGAGFWQGNDAYPQATLLRFLQSTYRAAAALGRREDGLECGIGMPGRPRLVALL